MMAAGAESPVSSSLRTLARNTGLLRLYYRGLEFRKAMSYPRPPPQAPDGKPFPNRIAMMRIGGVSDWKFFFERGRIDAETFVNVAKAEGADPSKWRAILDWGCGCGRLARHMSSFTPARIIGRDIDRYTLKWCARNLQGDFRTCRLNPPLDLTAASVDFVYGFSVLTHLTGPMQARWFKELARVLRTDGVATLSFHDLDHPAAREVQLRRESGGVSVTEWTMEGSNLVTAFQDYASICRAAEPWFEPVREIPRANTPFGQAIAVLRRRPTQS
jgi:SAM-dependent methyltransferase